MFTSRCLKLIIACLCSSLLLSSVPANLGNEVNADTWFSFEDQTPFGDKVYRSVEDCSYSVEVRNISSWSGHANIEFKITNTGSSTIHDWRLTFDYGYSIENPFNCYIIEHQDNLYTFGNNNWNQDIKPGQSVTVGFTAASSNGSSISDTPSFYLLNTKTVTLSSSDLSYRFEQYSDWGAGYNGALIFTNNSGETLRDWSITFNSNRPITQIDSAVLTTNSDGTYTISNDGNNQNIGNGQTYRVGVQGGYHDSSVAFELTNYSAYAKELAYSLSDDTNGNGVLDVLEIDAGGFFQIVTPTPEDTATPTPVISVTPTSSETPTPTATPTEIPDDIDYDTDTDSDGLPDDIEDYYGTNKYLADTDSDGVGDYYEFLLSTDPLVADTNGDNDYDTDGLSNAIESDLGTNPLSKDTDIDGISDYIESTVLGTDPKAYDTDNDGISDNDEIQMGLDPTLADSDGDGTPDNEEKVLQSKTVEFKNNDHPAGLVSVTVNAEISGCVRTDLDIDDVYFEDCVSSMIDGAIGVPVDISTEGDFDEAELIFEYDEDELGDSQAQDLVICWIDYDNGEIVPLDSTVDEANHTVSATTTHFSQYVLLDLRAYRKMWRENIAKALEDQGDRPVSQNNAFVVAIQMSDDLTLEQKQQEYDMVQAMLENLRPSDYITLIGYGGNENGYYAPYPHGITDSVRGDQEDAKVELLNEAYRWLFNYHDEPTNHSTSVERVYTALESIFYHGFEGVAYNNQFVLVTNGNVGDLGCSFWYAEVDANRYNYDFNVVMLGDTDVSIMADCYMLYRDGSGIQLSDSDVEPEDVITILYERLDYGDLWKDEDGDGIPDIIETFPVLTTFGYFVKVDPTKWSTDSDSLSDGKELIKQVFTCNYIYKLFYYSLGRNDTDYQFYLHNEYALISKSSCFMMNSHPGLADWDHDNAPDDFDWCWFKPNKSINYILIGKDYEGIENFELESMRIPYVKMFLALGQKVVVLDIYKDSNYFKRVNNSNISVQTAAGLFIFTMNYINCNLNANKITNKIKYSSVNKLIIISHGSADSLQFDPNSLSVSSSNINGSVNPPCKIKLIDIQACNCGRAVFDNDFGYYTCIAYELVKKTNIEKVYAWTGHCKYLVALYINCSFNGGRYREFYYSNGNINVSYVVPLNIIEGFPAYTLLQYNTDS